VLQVNDTDIRDESRDLVEEYTTSDDAKEELDRIQKDVNILYCVFVFCITVILYFLMNLCMCH